MLVTFGFSQIVSLGSLLENDPASVGSGIPEEYNPHIYVCCPRFLEWLGILSTFNILG